MIDRVRTNHWLILPHLPALLLSSLLATSCSKPSRFQPVYPVKGRVLVDGEPAAGVTVRFAPLDNPDDALVRPMATTDSHGWFVPATYKQHDGIPAGSYAVTMVWLPEGYKGRVEKANKLPASYSEPETSGIKVEIAKRENVLPPFELTK
jgi:hypothetical protein